MSHGRIATACFNWERREGRKTANGKMESERRERGSSTENSE